MRAVKYRNRLPREVADVLPLEIFKVRLKQGSELFDLVKDVPSPCRGVALTDLQTHPVL